MGYYRQDFSGLDFEKTVYGVVTLEQVKKEAEALPNFQNYGFSRTKLFWYKWDLCMSIAKDKPVESKSEAGILQHDDPGDSMPDSCGGLWTQ